MARGRHPHGYARAGAQSVKAALAAGAQFGKAPLRVKITRYGCEDVRGAHCTWNVSGRTYLAEIVTIYRNDVTGCWMLKSKHMDGTPAPDVSASYVELLERTHDNAD